jgi:hypothetical protein
VKKGPWAPEEDAMLKAYIDEHGAGGNWIQRPTSTSTAPAANGYSSPTRSVEILQRFGRAPGATRARRSVLDPHAFPTRVPGRRSAERGSPRRPAFPVTTPAPASPGATKRLCWACPRLLHNLGRLLAKYAGGGAVGAGWRRQIVH